MVKSNYRLSKNYLKFHLFIALIFCCFFNLNAQVEEAQKESLSQILVKIERQFEVSFSYADKTLENKFISPPDYQLPLPEIITYLEEKSGLNFESIDDSSYVIATKSKSPTSLSQPQLLQEVFVTKYLTSGLSKNNKGIITIKPNKLGILPGLIEPDVLQTVQSIPGIISAEESVSNLNIRGGTHDQNLILLDGIKMYQSGHFFGLISAFNPYLTKRIDVAKNGTPAMYGDGVSSVIDMRQSNSIDNEFKASLDVNLINIGGFIKAPISKTSEFQLSARRSFTDFATSPTYDQYFKRVFQDTDITNNQENSNNTITQNESFYFYDINAKYLWDITPSDLLRVNLLTQYNDLNYDEISTINTIDEALESTLKQKNYSGGITYTKLWSRDFQTSAQIYASNYDLRATNYDLLNQQRLTQENEVLETAIKLDASFVSNINFKFKGGYQFFEVGIGNLEELNNPVFRRYEKEVLRTHSVFTEAEYLSNNAYTKIVLGLRGNYVGKLDVFTLEPRISFSQRFAQYFKFEILGELKSQTTSQIIDLQNDFLGIEKRRWVLSNNFDMPITKSQQISAGFQYNHNDLLVSIEGFSKHVDGINSRSQAFQNQFQYSNTIGGYNIYGIDFLINKQFDNFGSWISYSYSENNYEFSFLNDGIEFPNNLDITHALTFAGTYTISSFKLALGINWHSGKPTTIPVKGNEVVNGTINFDSPNAERLDNYLRADFSGTYDFPLSRTTNATVGLSIWNIFNSNNVLNVYYSLDDNDNISKIENRALDITPNISFRVRF
ncbi:MAG: TonB-dependent receptor [Bacteroidetes bacterium MedPE-SWsnd-G2]|nr:MAG: TonB-dependent receptor [Bacteroidetes bacterium MedPE-SWsnd-G2]